MHLVQDWTVGCWSYPEPSSPIWCLGRDISKTIMYSWPVGQSMLHTSPYMWDFLQYRGWDLSKGGQESGLYKAHVSRVKGRVPRFLLTWPWKSLLQNCFYWYKLVTEASPHSIDKLDSISWWEGARPHCRKAHGVGVPVTTILEITSCYKSCCFN